MQYRPTDAQKEAWEHNLEKAREVRTEEAKTNKEMHFMHRHIPPKMGKSYTKINSEAIELSLNHMKVEKQ